MAATELVTVTLPLELVQGIDRFDRNRGRFIAQAVERELLRRRREGLLRALASPHPEAVALSEIGLGDWAASLPAGDEGLVDETAGTSVRWVQGQGWAVTGRLHGNTITLEAPVPALEGQRVRVLMALDDQDLTLVSEDQARLWDEWAQSGRQGPIEDDDVPELP
jgi:hypothetical protein